MDDLDHSGFAFDGSHMEFQIVGSKIAKGIAKIIPQELRRKIDLLDENTVRRKTHSAYRQTDDVPDLKSICNTEQKLPSEQSSVRFSRQCCDRAKFRDKHPSVNVIFVGRKI